LYQCWWREKKPDGTWTSGRQQQQPQQ